MSAGRGGPAVGRTKGAVAALLFRGLKKLRQLLNDPEGD